MKEDAAVTPKRVELHRTRVVIRRLHGSLGGLFIFGVRHANTHEVGVQPGA